MSYQVLARKFRPRNFNQMIGQTTTIQILSRALETQRLHHAYLFTGIRGTGKTTLARILAKCLNCEMGITAHPCDRCSICQDINHGRFIDLIEVDAASRTKVEDMRELLDNVQYTPTRGRFKTYLIDEVHMISGHSANALLKTLEEPPPHVKFLFATTDPQKLPETVLSRCLIFHLTSLNASSIVKHLQMILQEENIPYELSALQKIAKLSQGSVRDALSLLDQAIAFSHENLTERSVHTMLEDIEWVDIELILNALALQDGHTLLQISEHLFECGIDFGKMLDELISTFHSIAILQLLPQALIETPHLEMLLKLSQQFTKEDIQLYYQIALMGRKDLPLLTHPKIGFEMTLLRLLAFQPVKIQELNRSNDDVPQESPKPDSAFAPSPSSHLNISPLPPSSDEYPLLIADWCELVEKLHLSGSTHNLALHCSLQSIQHKNISLSLSSRYSFLLNEQSQDGLHDALNRFFQHTITLNIQIENTDSHESPAYQTKRLLAQKKEKELKNLYEDQNVQMMIDQLGVSVHPDLVQIK